MPQFCYDSVVRGYHVYKDVWEASLGELLNCERETGNSFDPFAVCVRKHDDIVGHVPRKISAICSLFLRRGRRIQCEVTGTRQYSRDIPQGGLEIPCRYIFEGDIQKVKRSISVNEKAVKSAKEATSNGKDVKEQVTHIKKEQDGEDEKPNVKKEQDVTIEKEQDVKRIRLDGKGEEASSEANTEWVRIFNIVLKFSDRDTISTGQELTDVHINAAQKLILYQFPVFQGLKNTLIIDSIGFWTNNYLQILHCRSCHWITVSTIGCQPNEVNVYDSLYTNVDDGTKRQVEKVFRSSVKFNLPSVQKQVGMTDCGLFAIAFATSLAFGSASVSFKQDSLRLHLQKCFEEKCIHPFPSL